MTFDAVVVGAGPNGLVAGCLLADAGWSVLVLEAAPTPGGAVRSDRSVHPDFVHDTCSAFYPFSAASPVLRSLDLEAHGLEWRQAPAVLAHAFGDGRWGVLHRDAAETARLAELECPGDGEAWLAMVEEWERIGPALTEALSGPCSTAATSRATASASPSAASSTLPSGRLRTQPSTPRRPAVRCTNQRNPTPCTMPVTRNLLVTRARPAVPEASRSR